MPFVQTVLGALLAVVQVAGSAESLCLLQAHASYRHQEQDFAGTIDDGDLAEVLARRPLRKHSEGSIIHFLFLLNNEKDLFTSQVWLQFFAAAPPNSYRLLGHCSDVCDERKIRSLLPGIKLVERVPSSYCKDLVAPMAQLLKSAIRDTTPHPNAMDKFVFVSGDTLPTKPFPVLFRALTSSVQSDICILSPNDWATATIDGKWLKIVKHSQWAVLNIAHAKRIVKYWGPNPRHYKQARGSRWLISIPSGRFVPRELFTGAVGKPGAHCLDEEAFFATIFGAVQEAENTDSSRRFNHLGRVQLASHAPAHARAQGRCHTYVAWAVRPGSLAGFIDEDPDSDIQGSRDKSSYAHPLEIRKLSNRSLAAIRAYPSLFIRKISHRADLSNYGAVVLSEDASAFKGYNVPVFGHIRLVSSSPGQDDRCLAVNEKDNLRLTWSKCVPGIMSSRFVVPESGPGLVRWGFFLDKCLATEATEPSTKGSITLTECDQADANQTSFIIEPERNSSTSPRWLSQPSRCIDSVEEDALISGGSLRLSDCQQSHHLEVPRLSYEALDLY